MTPIRSHCGKGGKPLPIDAAISIRPEDLEIHTRRPEEGRNIWQGKIMRGVDLGNLIDYQVLLGGER